MKKSAKKVIFFLALALFLASGAIVILLLKLNDYFVYKHELMVLPYIKKYQDSTAFVKPGLRKISFIGDSRAYAWAQSFRVKGYQDFNFGSPGFSTFQKLIQMEESGYFGEADIAVIQLGINDLKCISLFPDKRDEIIYNCINNIKKITEITALRDTIVVITSIFHVPHMPFSRKLIYGYLDLNSEVDLVNNELKKLESDKIKIFDVNQFLVNSNGNIRDEYVKDYLHINRKAYLLLNDKLVEFLNHLNL